MIDTATTLAIVKHYASVEFWHAVGTVLAVAILHVVAVCAFVRAYDTIRTWCSWIRRNFVQGVIALAFSAGIAYYGMTKGTITYPRTDPETWYLLDNGSYVTNDAVHVGFTRNLIVPATANFFIDGLALEYTNQSDWAEHSFNAYSNTLSNMSVPFDMAWPSATNYNWIAYTDWTPPPATHTNGVAYIVWQIGASGPTNNIAMTRTGVYTNAVRIAPNPSITNGPSVTVTTTLLQELENENE